MSNITFSRKIGQNICFLMFNDFCFEAFPRINDFKDFYETLEVAKFQHEQN